MGVSSERAMLDATAGRGKRVLAFAGHQQGLTMQARPGQTILHNAGPPDRAPRSARRTGP